ncbi:Thermonuclease [Candidatus Roizmanbacteria bacterium]|nr:Thermonuclease [Candidatus Roizmanbacteria bacterium]
MYNEIVKRIKKILISSFVLVVVFILGFFSKDYFVKNKPSSSTPISKVKNILLPEPKDGKYKVIEVIDGDTVRLETGEKFRFLGIDAPEINVRWGPEAKEFVVKTLLNKKVRVEFDQIKLDRYGRLLGYLWIDPSAGSGQATLIQEKLLEVGYAKISLMKGEVKPKYLDRLQKAESWAKQNHDGVWFDEWEKDRL